MDPSQGLTDEQAAALVGAQIAPPAAPQGQAAAPAQQSNGPAADAPYPVQDGGSLTPAQNSTAWQLYHAGVIQPGAAQGTPNSPYIVQPGRPASPGAYIIDRDTGQYGQAGQDGFTVSHPAGMSDDEADAATRSPWWEDAAKSVGSGLYGGLASTADMLNPEAGLRLGMSIANPHLPSQAAPYLAQSNTDVANQHGADYQPQYPADRYLKTIASFAPAAVGGEGSALERGLSIAASGSGSEGLGELADQYLQPQYAVLARMLGAGLGGFGAALTTSPSRAASLLASAGKDVSPADLAAAQALRTQGEGYGVPLTIPEAVAQVSRNGNPQLAQLQQRVEGSAAGGPVMAPMMQTRPSAAAAALAEAVRQVGSSTDQPSMVGANAQAAAKGVIGGLQNERTALVHPYYAAAGPTTVDPVGMQDLMASIDDRIAGDKTGIMAAPLGKLRDLLTDNEQTAAQASAQSTPAAPESVRDSVERSWAENTGQPAPGVPAAPPAANRVPLLDIENLDRARQYMRDQTASQVASGHLTSEQGAAVGQHLDQLDQLMEAASPDFRGAKANFSQFSNEVLKPVQAGPVGRIAATANPATQASALYPANPLPGAPAETTAAANALSAQDANVVAALTRQHLERAGNEALKTGANGPNPYGPAAFAARVAGNPEQAATLAAGVSAAAGPAVSEHVANLIKVLSATGRRLPVTASDAAQAAALDQPHPFNSSEFGVALGVAKEAAGLPGLAGLGAIKGTAALVDAIRKAKVNAGAAQLAKDLTGPAVNTAKTLTVAQAKQAAHAQNLARAVAAAGIASGANSRGTSQ